MSSEAKKDSIREEVYTTDDSETAYQIPDGGVKACLSLVGQWLVLFATFGYLYSFGVYEDYYTRIYLTNHDPSDISWIGSFQFMMPFLVGLLSGKLFDVGYFYVLEILGSIIFVFSLFMLSLAKPNQYYQVFLSQAVGMGIGLGLTFIPTVGLTAHHWRRWRGLAAGIALSGSSCGAIAIPIMLKSVVVWTSSERESLVYGRAVPECHDSVRFTFLRVFVIPTILYTSSGLFASFGFYFPVIYLQLYAVQHSVDLTLAFYSLAIVNGCGAIGRVVGNFLSDLYGPFNLLVITSLSAAATIWAILGVNDRASLIVVSILYGIFSGAWLSLVVASLAFLSKTPKEVGARTGIGIAFSSFGTLGAAPAQGALLTSQFFWIRPIAFSGTVMIAAAGVFFVSRTLLVKERGTQKV
ncbi:MFS general substrate transporter [Fomitiporia mediterranea MF3/22]|uniref:MFS general substrate transporter n=1 Tax=Fomitiporia mediterranea (strain MF3/22) TaxID=694068 RepID=UPI00044073E2|nr:MFS general substrate transporter [Fomitiporia mediterranea MF3/22]EJD00107.1 MFS general substrate transporter [Fomitiporia mediterranea MF3/22]